MVNSILTEQAIPTRTVRLKGASGTVYKFGWRGKGDPSAQDLDAMAAEVEKQEYSQQAKPKVDPNNVLLRAIATPDVQTPPDTSLMGTVKAQNAQRAKGQSLNERDRAAKRNRAISLYEQGVKTGDMGLIQEAARLDKTGNYPIPENLQEKQFYTEGGTISPGRGIEKEGVQSTLEKKVLGGLQKGVGGTITGLLTPGALEGLSKSEHQALAKAAGELAGFSDTVQGVLMNAAMGGGLVGAIKVLPGLARAVKGFVKGGRTAEEAVSLALKDFKTRPDFGGKVSMETTPPGLAETVGAKRPKAEPAAKPLEDGQTPFKTKVEDIVLADRDTPYNLVDVAKSGGFSWEGVAPKHAKRLRALGVTADDLTQVVADRMESLAMASSRQNLDSGVLRLKTGTKLSDGELKAILQDIRGNRQRLRDMGYNTAGYLPTKEETVARTAPQVPKAEPKKTPLKTVVLSDKEGKQFPAHASDFTDEDLLNQLDKKRQAARDIATHQPTNANGKATMHDVRELQAEVDRRGLGGSKDIGEPPKTPETTAQPPLGSTFSPTKAAEPRTVAHADTEKVLADWGETLRESNPETINQWVNDAANSKRAPRDVAKEVLADPRPMTKEEQIQLGIRMNQIDEEVKAGVKDNIEEGVEIVRALDAAGSEWGRSGLSRQILLRTNYSEVALKARAEQAAPKGLNAKQVGLIEAQAKRIAELEAQVANRTPRPVRTREVIQAERSKIIDEIKAIRQEAMSQISDAPQFVGHVAQIIPKAVKVGVLYLEEGAVAAGELLGKLRADFGDTFTEEQYAQINRDAIGEHGRNLNAGRKAYGEDIQVKGTAGIQDKEIKVLRAKLDLAKRDADALIERLRPKTTGEKLITVANIPRSLQASVDVSAPGRQGWYGLFVDPKGWAKGWSAQAKAMVSPERAMQELNVIKDHPEYHTAVQSGLHMNEIDAPLTAGEEAMFGNVVGRTHPKLKGKSIPNPFAGSERAYNAFLNRQRLDMFTNLKKKLGESASEADLKGLANFVNVVTGRGGASIPGFKQAAGFLSTGFYSPKFLASRIELAIGAPILKSGLSKQARFLLAKQHLKITAAQLTSLSLLVYGAKKAFGDENVTLNNDPSSSDYGKLQIKDGERTVFMDTGAGVLAPMVAAFRFGTGKTTSASGNVKKLDEDYGASREALVGRFIRSKLNPTVGAAWSLISGKNYIGEKYGAKEAAKELLLPMSPREITEELMTDGMSKADVLTLFNLVGISVNTYKKPSPK